MISTTTKGRRFVIGARKSALARLQAYHVAAALKRRNPHIEVEFFFQEAAGDRDLTTPLWKMPDKGVFTRDLTEALLNRQIDFVIHSHKDLETEPTKGTQILSVLPRADARDLFLYKKSSLKKSHPKKTTIYTSSPRRQYNLQGFLSRALPQALRPDEGFFFEAIRGNIQTRLRKFRELPGDGFVIAKAALDRILREDFPESDEAEFPEVRAEIRAILSECVPMVLPLSWNPCAPAQGAFAMELRQDDDRVMNLAEGILHRMTEEAVQIERRILAGYGGGCHQKIGAAHLPLGSRSVTFLRGLTDEGEVLDLAYVREGEQESEGKATNWPPEDWSSPEQPSAFWEVCPSKELPDPLSGASISFEELPELRRSRQGLLASATTADWFLCADKDIWIHASADGLGWPHAPELEGFSV